MKVDISTSDTTSGDTKIKVSLGEVEVRVSSFEVAQCRVDIVQMEGERIAKRMLSNINASVFDRIHNIRRELINTGNFSDSVRDELEGIYQHCFMPETNKLRI